MGFLTGYALMPSTRTPQPHRRVAPVPRSVRTRVPRDRGWVPRPVAVVTCPRAPRRCRIIRIAAPLLDFERRTACWAALHRVREAACYRFYRDDAAPPVEGSEPWATAPSLAYTPPDTFSDGTWYLAVSYYNGFLDSGFLPLGPRGETYRTLTIDSGEQVAAVPRDPQSVQLQVRSGGVVRVFGLYGETGTGRGDAWFVLYTTDGSDPRLYGTQVVVQISGTLGLSVLQYDLPAQSDGTTVKVAVGIRRGTSPNYVYSDSRAAHVYTATADAAGPASGPLSGYAAMED